MDDVGSAMTHDGPLDGLPTTGRRVALLGASILHLEAGLVEERRFYTNVQ